MRYRSVTLLLAVGTGVIILAAGTGRTERSEGGYDLRYVSIDRDRGGGAIAATGGAC